jgi:transcriptional regulator with XRE-family HTH domain
MAQLATLAALKPGLKPIFGARFRVGRQAAGRSLAEVGAACGVSLQAIGQFERGAQRLDLEVFTLACLACGLSVRWVLLGRGEMMDKG